MTSLVDALYQIKYNPFKYSHFLVSFYSELNNVSDNLLLAQLIIPLCSHDIFKKKISNAVFGENKKSSIWTIFNDKTKLYDLQNRIDDLKALTDQSLQYCILNDWLSIDPTELNVITGQVSDTTIRKEKSATNLAKLFNNFSVIEIYALLGVAPK